MPENPLNVYKNLDPELLKMVNDTTKFALSDGALSKKVKLLMALALDVIVVDDCSADSTYDTAAAAGASVIRHHVNMGKGAALSTGLAFAAEKGFDAVITLDADGQHAPSETGAFIECFRETNADIIVDAIFGTGLTGQLRDDFKMLIETVNSLGKPVLAVDIPSGLDCDTGMPLGAGVKAKWTITFAALKKGFDAETAREFTGEVYVASIGVEPDLNHKT